MKKQLHLGRGVYISLLYSKKRKKQYKVVLKFYDITGKIARIQVDYCDTYIDAIYHYYNIRD